MKPCSHARPQSAQAGRGHDPREQRSPAVGMKQGQENSGQSNAALSGSGLESFRFGFDLGSQKSLPSLS